MTDKIRRIGRTFAAWYGALSLKALLSMIAMLTAVNVLVTLTAEDQYVPEYDSELSSISSGIGTLEVELARLESQMREIARDVDAINGGYCDSNRIC